VPVRHLRLLVVTGDMLPRWRAAVDRCRGMPGSLVMRRARLCELLDFIWLLVLWNTDLFQPYAFCVSGNNVCNQNDTVTSAANCTAIELAASTVCESLTCKQCVDADYEVGCQWCGTPTGGQCTSKLFCDAEEQLYDSSLCSAPNACEQKSCTDCLADPNCSFCGNNATYGGYGFCILGKNMCKHNDAVLKATQCAALPFDICPTLSCDQCFNSTDSAYYNSYTSNYTSYGSYSSYYGGGGACQWCESAPGNGSCTSSFSCPRGSNYTYYDVTGVCPALNHCERKTCDACLIDLTCSMCYDTKTGIAACVLGSHKCDSIAVTTASQCATIPVPTSATTGTSGTGTTLNSPTAGTTPTGTTVGGGGGVTTATTTGSTVTTSAPVVLATTRSTAAVHTVGSVLALLVFVVMAI